MKREIEVGATVFFMGQVSPWFWHKGVVSKVDEGKGLKIGKAWYSESSVLKDTPQMAAGLLAMNIEKSMLMCKGGVQFEGEKLDSYLSRIRAEETKTGDEQ